MFINLDIVAWWPNSETILEVDFILLDKDKRNAALENYCIEKGINI